MTSHSVQLRQLIAEIEARVYGACDEVWINGIVEDSRRVQPGNLFVAYKGGTFDGHKYILDAIQKGALAILGTQPISGLPVPYVQVSDSRLALAQIAAAYYDYPARKLLVIGITGTDGKTTTSNLVFSILKQAGLSVSMISTVNAIIGNQEVDTGFHVTTPDALDVQNYLAQMVKSGSTHAILEATSHGLAQHRVSACDFDIGVITNITHEHLDYHGSYEAYRSAKGLLFNSLEYSSLKTFNPPRCAVLNFDDASYSYLAQISRVTQLSYGANTNANVQAKDILDSPDGLTFTVEGKRLDGSEWTIPVKTTLVGVYNVSNILAALATCVGVLGIDPQVARIALQQVKKVPGRMEFIKMGQSFLAIVDFAHTPNALKQTLAAARSLTDSRVIAVFGSAGLRDREKRRMMAETSASMADITILTAEDPRSESLALILEEMAEGIRSKGGVEGVDYWRIEDRGDAIRFAVQLASQGDIVLACGKGHEQSMCFGETEYAWDDRVAMQTALSELLGIPGPEMPYLPTKRT